MKPSLILIIATLSIITIALALLKWFQLSPHHPSPPTPTPITATEFYPPYGSTNYLQDAPPTFTFSSQPTHPESCQVTLNPKTTFSLHWISNTTLQLILSNPLKPNTTYTLTVNCPSILPIQNIFTTNPNPFTQLQQQASDQIADDYLFAQAWNQTIEKYPFYQDLPIETNEFEIFYDFDQQSFRIYNKSGLANNIILDSVLNTLNQLKGIPQPPPYYFVKP